MLFSTMTKPRPAPRGSKRLAASFVLTVATISACKHAPVDDGRMPNPPFPPPDDSGGDAHAAPPPHSAPAPSASAAARSSVASPPLGAAPPGTKLCSATNDARPCINKDGDICMFLPVMVKCKPGGPPCNPPAIHRVPCP